MFHKGGEWKSPKVNQWLVGLLGGVDACLEIRRVGGDKEKKMDTILRVLGLNNKQLSFGLLKASIRSFTLVLSC
jgi:hypothetical protein